MNDLKMNDLKMNDLKMNDLKKNNLLQFNIIKQKYDVKNTVIFIGNGNRDFGLRVAEYFPKCLSSMIPERFNDGEIKIPAINENCRQKDCVIIQSCSYHPNFSINDLLMEVFIMIDTVKRSNAKTITVVLPIFPYQRQDRKSYSRSPITASMVSTMLENSGINRVICFELHAGQIQGFFNKLPVDNLTINNYFIKCINNISLEKSCDISDFVIVSPDEGGVKRASKLSKLIKSNMALIHKERNKDNEVGEMVLMGNVNGKCCIIIDDMIDTGGTMIKACDVLRKNGADNIAIMVCHGILSKDAINKIRDCNSCDVVYVSNTVDVLSRVSEYGKIKIIDITELCAAAIYKGINGESVSELL